MARLKTGLTLLALTLTSCGKDRQVVVESAPDTWRLSSLPAVDIGVAEGDGPQELAGASSSIRLPDGRIIVANSGSSELRFFDSQGRFLHTSGRKGSGPGEFDGAIHLIPLGPETFAAFVDPRLSLFDTSGSFLSARLIAQNQEIFPLPTWLYRQNWVDGPVDVLKRPAVGRALDRLPAVPPGAYRYVKVADDERIWSQVRTSDPGDSATAWLVYDPGGSLLATIAIPAAMEIHQIGKDFLLARRWAENQVEHIQLFRIDGAAPTTSEPSIPVATVTTDSIAPSTLADMTAGLQRLVMAEEAHYADAGEYAQQATDLQWAAPEGTTLHLMAADKRGWVGLLAHKKFPVVCGMAVGGSTPPGWKEGSPRCSITHVPEKIE
ncbi:MAG: 6-bladed beta-propeller [Gemmatimonadota bacterium]